MPYDLQYYGDVVLGALLSYDKNSHNPKLLKMSKASIRQLKRLKNAKLLERIAVRSEVYDFFVKNKPNRVVNHMDKLERLLSSSKNGVEKGDSYIVCAISQPKRAREYLALAREEFEACGANAYVNLLRY